MSRINNVQNEEEIHSYICINILLKNVRKANNIFHNVPRYIMYFVI